jgi:hypothetical protein
MRLRSLANSEGAGGHCAAQQMDGQETGGGGGRGGGD